MLAAKVENTPASPGWPLACTIEIAHDRGDVGEGLALQRLEHVLEAARAAEADDRRQVRAARRRPAPTAANSRRELLDQRLGAERGIRPLLVGLQADDEEGLVRGGDGVDEVVADDGGDALDRRLAPDDLVHLPPPSRRSGSARRPRAAAAMAKMAPWSSSGRKPCGVVLKVTPVRKTDAGQDGEAEDRDPDQPAHDPGVAGRHPVDAGQHPADRPARPAVAVGQQHRAQGRRRGTAR